MNVQQKVSRGQLGALLILSGAFRLLAQNRGGTPAGLEAVFLPLAAAGIQLLFVTVALFLLRRREGEGFADRICRYGGRLPGGVLCWLLGGWLLLAAADTAAQASFFLTSAVFPQAPAPFFVLTLVLAGVYALRKGLEGLCRSAAVIGVVAALAMGVILLASAEHFQPAYLYFSGESAGSFLGQAFSEAVRSPEPVLFLLFCGRVKGKGFGSAVLWVTVSGGIFSGAALLLWGVLGRTAGGQLFPFFTLTAIAEFSVFRRMDAIYMGLWILIGLLRIAALMLGAQYCIGKTLPANRESALGLLMAGSVFAGGALLAGRREWLLGLESFFRQGWGVVFVCLILPVIFLISGKRKGKRRAADE